jgi:hypothetical protein
MSDLNINDANFLRQCESGISKAIRKRQDFREPKENKRKDNKRTCNILLDEASFQYVVDEARFRNVSINSCISEVVNKLIIKSKNNAQQKI